MFESILGLLVFSELFLFAITLTPLFLNRKYMAAGLEQTNTENLMIPNMQKVNQEEE